MTAKVLAAEREEKPAQGSNIGHDELRERRAEAAYVLAETLLDLWVRRGR